MIDALSAAIGSMDSDLSRMTVISQNLVNGTTPGYKRQMALTRPFPVAFERLAEGRAAQTAALPATILETALVTDHRVGTLRPTGNPLDMALEGEGAFFEVMTDSGVAYTRQGNFRLDQLGRLVTEAGRPVMGVAGEIYLSGGDVTVDAAGNLREAGTTVAQLKIVQFAQPERMRAAGAGLFQQGESELAAADSPVRLRQGYLEMSNVSTMAEMVKLVETMRHFEAAQKVVQGLDEMHERALRKLGEF